MSFLSSLVKPIISGAVGFAQGGPLGAFVGGASALKQQQESKKFQKIALEAQQNMANQNPILSGNIYPTPRPNNLFGNGGFGSSIGSFLTDATSNILNPLGGFFTGLTNLFGGGRPTSTIQQPAVTSVTNIGAQESSGSGSIQAGVGSVLNPLVQGINKLVTSPLGSIALGTGAGLATSLIGPDGKTRRITRKMKSQARMLLNLNMGNLDATASMLGISQEELVFILLKRFRNDGPVITKAALRKTKSTVRKLKNMCDMYDDLRPRATARRRSPMRKSTTTLIKN